MATKVTISAGKNECLNKKLLASMSDYKTKGFRITCSGYDWFMIEKSNSQTP
jgi:hypothetical protein